MKRTNYLFVLITIMFIFLSCTEEEKSPGDDYSIKSDNYFTLISQYKNGWVKEGQHGLDNVVNEFEYHENGFIKSAKLYSEIPNYHMYMEVERNENNQALWSKYYRPDKSLWFETKYENGTPLEKKIYSDKGITVYHYENGEIKSTVFTGANNNLTTKVIYNKAAGNRTVDIVENNESILKEEYSYYEKCGAGINSNTFSTSGNPFYKAEPLYLSASQGFSQSPVWQPSLKLTEYLYPYRFFEDFSISGFRPQSGISLAITDDLFQSILEQYPFFEDRVLIGGFWAVSGYDSYRLISVRDEAIEKSYLNDTELFTTKYGDHYVSKAIYGKNYVVIGAIRNLPTDANLANKIKDIARLKLNALIGSGSGITEEEKVMLGKVWFEVKIFSNLKKHQNGVVLNTSEDYDKAIKELSDAEESVLQLIYRKYSYDFY